MSSPPALPTLLSQVLVAFTIEFDNEAERQLEAGGPRPWLASQAMWSNYLRFIEADGLSVGDLRAMANVSDSDMRSRLGALARWRYVEVGPDPADGRSKSPRRDWVVRFTPAGRRAGDIWRPLAGVIEERWRDRFGAVEIAGLRESLESLVGELDLRLPRYLPIVGHSMFARPAGSPQPAARSRDEDTPADLDLSALVSQVLLAFTLQFEERSRLSMPIGGNVLRVLPEPAIRVRDLPSLAGVSKEAAAVALGYLERQACAVVEPEPAASRGKVARLTERGLAAQHAYGGRLLRVEQHWQTRFGADRLGSLRESLHRLIDERDSNGTPLLSVGLVPHPGGWRSRPPYAKQTAAMIRDPAGALPHYPMVLHRGGFPDGS